MLVFKSLTFANARPPHSLMQIIRKCFYNYSQQNTNLQMMRTREVQRYKHEYTRNCLLWQYSILSTNQIIVLVDCSFVFFLTIRTWVVPNCLYLLYTSPTLPEQLHRLQYIFWHYFFHPLLHCDCFSQQLKLCHGSTPLLSVWRGGSAILFPSPPLARSASESMSMGLGPSS